MTDRTASTSDARKRRAGEIVRDLIADLPPIPDDQTRHDELVALLTEIRDRLPDPKPAATVRLGGQEFPAHISPALDEDGAPPALVGDPAALDWGDDLPGEPVEPGDLRAGDRVAFTWSGKRITCTLVSVREGAILRSDTPDKDDYYPNVVVQGKWCSAISDVRLIERAPREDEDPDEALAKVLRSASERLGDWGALHETTRDEYRNMARAAREHIEAEWKPYILREQTAREKAQDRAAKAEAERDALRERLDALRADVDRHARRAGKKVWTRATGRDAAVQDALWDILARDTARAKGER